MSDTYLRLIPTDPAFVPETSNQVAAQALLAGWLPDAIEVTVNVDDHIHFVDQGSNFKGVYCPSCGTEISTQWWHAAMDEASATRFSDLRAIVPCCNVATSLNDLRYEWPAGFARFVLEAQNPTIPDVQVDQLHLLEHMLGCTLRTIWAHY